jgi:hypothetical protein
MTRVNDGGGGGGGGDDELDWDNGKLLVQRGLRSPTPTAS